MKNNKIIYNFTNNIKSYKIYILNFITNELKNLLTISITVNLLLITIILNPKFFQGLIINIKYNISNNFTIENYNNFLTINKYFIIFLLILWIGICFDSRFLLSRKILLPIYLTIWIIILLLFSDNSFIWTEIFWYTLMLNISFIFHVCICDWLYRLSEYYRKEYLSFLITRVSFILSLSFIIYVLHIIFLWVDSKYNKKFHYFFEFIVTLINILLLILIYFVDLFANYSLFLMG